MRSWGMKDAEGPSARYLDAAYPCRSRNWRLQVTITNGSGVVGALRTASVVIPQIGVAGRLKKPAIGSYSFVASARAERKLTDIETSAILAGVAPQRDGDAFITVVIGHWSDENAR